MSKIRPSTQIMPEGSPLQVLRVNAAGTAIEAATPGSLTVQDENANVATGVTQIDFQGAGVTATAGTGEVVVTIPGGSGSLTVQDEGTALTQRSVIDFVGAGVTATDDAANSRTVVTIPGGSGSGTTINDYQWAVPSGATSIDEFTSTSLDSAWVRVDSSGGSGRCTWTEGGDVLSAVNAGGDAASELHALVRPIGTSMVAGDAFVTRMQMVAAFAVASPMCGLVLANGTTYGAGVQTLTRHFHTTTAGQLINDAAGFSNYNSGTAASSNIATTTGAPFYSRLVMTAANTWRCDISPDGVSWVTGATVAATLTPTYVGLFCSSWGNANKLAVRYDFLRRVSGVA